MFKLFLNVINYDSRVTHCVTSPYATFKCVKFTANTSLQYFNIGRSGIQVGRHAHILCDPPSVPFHSIDFGRLGCSCETSGPVNGFNI